MRRVICFLNLDRAQANVRDRGDCVLFDLHGLWWSVPAELTIREFNDQISDEIDRMGGQREDATPRGVRRPTPTGSRAGVTMPKIAVSPIEAGEMIGCTRQHIYALIERGELRAGRHGRLIRIPVADVYRFVGIDDPDELVGAIGAA